MLCFGKYFLELLHALVLFWTIWESVETLFEQVHEFFTFMASSAHYESPFMCFPSNARHNSARIFMLEIFKGTTRKPCPLSGTLVQVPCLF